MGEDCLRNALLANIGRTVTIFTVSGGLSGSGFTGVLAGISCDCVRLITDIGAPPSCPIGSACTPGYNNCNCNPAPLNYGWLGSVTEIPLCKIACFTHHSI